MNKIGFIGYGSMGKMIIKGFMSSNIIEPGEMIISTRNMDKLDELKKIHPKIEITSNKLLLADKCSKIILMVNTTELKNVLEEIKPNLSPDTHIIYISAGVTIKELETIFPGKISHVIPSVTGEVSKGVILISHSERVDDQDIIFVDTLFKSLGQIKTVFEEDMERATVLTSCFPAFITFFCKKFSDEAIRQGTFSQKEVDYMIKATLDGTSKLLLEIDFDELISRVATRGGITEAGLQVMDSGLSAMFKELFQVTIKTA